VKSQTKTLAQALSKFGLTEYESSVYLALLESGDCDIKGIVAKSNVPRTKVYPVLKSLKNMHLANFLPGKTVRARALMPDSTMLSKIKDLSQDVNVMKRAIVDIRKIHESSPSLEQLEKREYWLSRSQEDSIKRFNDAITNASDEILITVNHEGLDILSSYCFDSIVNASRTDVQIKIMINATKQDLPTLHRFDELIEIKFIPFTPVNNLILADGKELLIFKKVTLIDSKTTTIVSEYYTGSAVCDFLKSTSSDLEWGTARDMRTLIPAIQNSWLPENFISEAKVNQIPPVFFFNLIDSMSTRLGGKMDSSVIELGKKTLDTMVKSLNQKLPPELPDALNLLSSLYLIHEGVQARFAYDAPLNLITCELSGAMTPHYKAAADRGFKIPPSIWGFCFMGLLDIFGYDASAIHNAYNTGENFWTLQYQLSTRGSGKSVKVGSEPEIMGITDSSSQVKL